MKLALKIRRYDAIIKKLQSFPGATIEALVDAVEFEVSDQVSARTVQRDISELKNEFHFPISFDKYANGYKLTSLPDNKGESFIDQAVSVFNSFNNMSLLQTDADLIDISFLKSEVLSAQFDSLIKALKSRNQVNITYYKMSSGTIETYIVSSYMVKEYEYKWYLIAKDEEDQIDKSYAIDRIKTVSVLSDKSTVNRKSTDALRMKLENTIGVSFFNNSPVLVKIAVSNRQDKYLKEFPIHHSQELVKKGSEVNLVTFKVVVNNELLMKLLMMGSNVRVIEPLKLKEKLHCIAKSMYENVDSANIKIDEASKMFF